MGSLIDYQRFWREQSQREEEERMSLLELLRRRAKEAAGILVKEFKAKKVYLIGSTAGGAFFHKHSDVDLAVMGLAPPKYFSALAKMRNLFAGKSEVDLIPLEDATPEMRAKIEKQGELLNEEI